MIFLIRYKCNETTEEFYYLKLYIYFKLAYRLFIIRIDLTQTLNLTICYLLLYKNNKFIFYATKLNLLCVLYCLTLKIFTSSFGPKSLFIEALNLLFILLMPWLVIIKSL